MADEARPEDLEGQSHAQRQESLVYEVGFHVVPTIAEEGLPAVVEKIRSLLKDAEIIAEQFPQKIALAYTIERSHSGKREKYKEAYFGWIKFATSPEAAHALGGSLREMRDIVRYLLISTVREEAPAPRRAIFTSDRLEGQTLRKPTSTPEKSTEVSEEELDKSIDALVGSEEIKYK
jgi:ribosomal protein S6